MNGFIWSQFVFILLEGVVIVVLGIEWTVLYKSTEAHTKLFSTLGGSYLLGATLEAFLFAAFLADPYGYYGIYSPKVGLLINSIISAVMLVCFNRTLQLTLGLYQSCHHIYLPKEGKKRMSRLINQINTNLKTSEKFESDVQAFRYQFYLSDSHKKTTLTLLDKSKLLLLGNVKTIFYLFNVLIVLTVPIIQLLAVLLGKQWLKGLQQVFIGIFCLFFMTSIFLLMSSIFKVLGVNENNNRQNNDESIIRTLKELQTTRFILVFIIGMNCLLYFTFGIGNLVFRYKEPLKVPISYKHFRMNTFIFNIATHLFSVYCILYLSVLYNRKNQV